jgi:hypothetical protein
MQVTAALTATTKYTLTCVGAGGTAAQSTTVTVTTPAPTLALSVTPASVITGGSSQLSWTSNNATACAASGNWSGSQNLSGSQSTGAITANSTYTLTCSGAGGSIARSVSVTVTSGSATLSWSPPTQDAGGGTLTPLSGYTIYYGNSQGSLANSVVVSGAETTSYTVTGLGAGTWYFGIKANATDGTQSALSNIGSKAF